MKKFILPVLLLLSMLLLSCESKAKSYLATTDGFSKDLKLEVTIANEKISDINLVSHTETPIVIDRAFPILKNRILEAQSPIVDSVSGATYTSLGVKRAVAQALKSAGKDFGRITLKTKAPEKPVQHLPVLETDLLIVGGGPAGMTAAISAKESGINNIVLIEKLDILSGNAKYNKNFYDLINSKAQKDAGINDSIEQFIKDNTNPMDTPERTRAQAEGSYKLDKWLRYLGIQLNHSLGGRSHFAEADRFPGEHIQEKMEEKMTELNIDVRTGTEGIDLIFENNKVVGIKAKNKNNFYDIKAKAVIVATGGFSANKELLKKYAPGHEIFETSNQVGATGDFIKISEKNNIKLANLDIINIFPIVSANTRELIGGAYTYLLVNNLGERFTSEDITYSNRSETAHNMFAQPNKEVFYIFDQKNLDSDFTLQKHFKIGLHNKVDNFNELAKFIGSSEENLKQTILDFNKFARGESEDKFRTKKARAEFSTEGPFYVVKIQPAIHMTRGGIVADENTQVYDNNNNIIPGLFAAGEVTNTSAAYSAAVVFGRIAGESAAKFIKK